MPGSGNLTDLLMTELSRRNTDLVADLIRDRPVLFTELMEIFLRNAEPVSRRAAWVADTVSEKHPELIDSYLGSLTGALTRFEHDGLKRHALRILSRSHLPQQCLGALMKTCFDWLISPKESVAVKVYAMEILYMMSQAEPDLKKELADSIEWRMAEETPGFKNRGMKLLRKLNKEMNSMKIR